MATQSAIQLIPAVCCITASRSHRRTDGEEPAAAARTPVIGCHPAADGRLYQSPPVVTAGSGNGRRRREAELSAVASGRLPPPVSRVTGGSRRAVRRQIF